MLTSTVDALLVAWNDMGNKEDNLAEVFATALRLSLLLDKLWISTVNRMFLTAAHMKEQNGKNVTLLSKEEVIEMTQEDGVINWDNFRTNLIVSIYKNWAWLYSF